MRKIKILKKLKNDKISSSIFSLSLKIKVKLAI